MNRYAAPILIMAALLCGWSSDSAADTFKSLPSLTITVIDGQSEKPLPGVTVHYMVIRETHWTAFPLTIEPHIVSDIVAPVTVRTDSNGVATFKDVKVELESYWLLPKAQRIDSEMLFVNLDPPSEWPHYMSHYENKYQYLRSTVPFLTDLDRPNKKYLGYLLLIANIPAENGREDEVATVRIEPETFRGSEPRNFLITLKPVEIDAQPAAPLDEPHHADSARR